jgi:hypothetical protein
MNKWSGSERSLVLSYLGLRKAIGIIGIALPFVLVLGKMIIEGPGIEGSISGYYYTVMRNVFVGSLCAVGVFLMSYKGYERKDYIAGKLACVFAVGVALFPTTPAINFTPTDKIIGTMHLVFAAAFFLTLAYFSLILFTKTNPSKTPTRRKQERNIVYRVCGYVMLGGIVLLGLVAVPAINVLVEGLYPTFWLESIAVIAFGVSWLTKGEAILKDVITPPDVLAPPEMSI